MTLPFRRRLGVVSRCRVRVLSPTFSMRTETCSHRVRAQFVNFPVERPFTQQATLVHLGSCSSPHLSLLTLVYTSHLSLHPGSSPAALIERSPAFLLHNQLLPRCTRLVARPIIPTTARVPHALPRGHCPFLLPLNWFNSCCITKLCSVSEGPVRNFNEPSSKCESVDPIVMTKRSILVCNPTKFEVSGIIIRSSFHQLDRCTEPFE